VSLRDGKTIPLVIVVAFPLGALVYGIHRAIVHPVCERLLTLMIIRGSLKLDTAEMSTWRGFTVALTDAEMFLFWARWDRLTRFPKVHDYMTRAASQMHFVYTVPLAFWIGCLAARMVDKRPLSFSPGWFGLSVGIFLIALIDNYRLSSIEINRVLALYDGTEGDADRAMPGGWRRKDLYPKGRLLLDLPVIILSGLKQMVSKKPR
jgi:hypothetical protein